MLSKKYFVIFSVLFFLLTNFNLLNQTLGKEVPITGNTEQLKYFFEAINKSKSDKVRIAHYGDSIILGDVITEYIRAILQEKFGGNGIGFIDVYSKANLMRKSIIHRFSNDWVGGNILQNKSKSEKLGISGLASLCGDKSWVTIEPSKHMKNSRNYSEVSLFYNGNGNAKFTFNHSIKKNVELTGSSLINKIELKNDQIKDLKIQFNNMSGNYIYGVSLEDGNGIYVDNFPITGDSGASLLNLNSEIIQGFRKHFNYKLIILNYGVNVSTPNKNVFKIYEKKMLKVIKHLKEQFPQTSILLVSAGDKTVKKGGRFITDKNIPKLLNTQENIAKKANIAFWNMAEAMGGKNSMNKWVSHAPPMALKDYLHFTHEGGERIAELMMKALLDEYKKYKSKM